MGRQALTDVSIQRTEAIASVLDFYYSDFTTYLATTIAYTEALPEEINNQIRDAFTHLSRASAAETLLEVQRECGAARTHIERANRDCLKVSIIKARAELEQLIADVAFYHGFLTPTMKATFARIKAERRAAYVSETKSDLTLVAKLEEILRMTMHLSDEIRDHYSVAGKKSARIIRKLKQWFRPVFYVLSALIGAIIGVLLKGQVQQFLPW